MESPPAFTEESVMRYTKLGSTGLEVSPIVLGAMTYGEPGRGYPAWSLTEEDSRPLIEHAGEAGINFFDTANWYSLDSSEEILERALKDYADRDNVVVCTKIRHAMRPGPNGKGYPARPSWPRSITVCAGWAPTTWTST
jgi:1-deoxyxylulose-5-phosphate synthase